MVNAQQLPNSKPQGYCSISAASQWWFLPLSLPSTSLSICTLTIWTQLFLLRCKLSILCRWLPAMSCMGQTEPATAFASVWLRALGLVFSLYHVVSTFTSIRKEHVWTQGEARTHGQPWELSLCCLVGFGLSVYRISTRFVWVTKHRPLIGRSSSCWGFGFLSAEIEKHPCICVWNLGPLSCAAPTFYFEGKTSESLYYPQSTMFLPSLQPEGAAWPTFCTDPALRTSTLMPAWVCAPCHHPRSCF